MGKLFTRMLSINLLLLLSFLNTHAQDALINGTFTNGWANQTFNVDTENQIYMFHFNAAVTSGTVNCFGSSAARYSVRPDAAGDYFEVQLNYPATTKTIDQVSFSVTANSSSVVNGNYGWSVDGTNWTDGAAFTMPTTASECATYTVAAPNGAKYFRIMRNSSSTNWAGVNGFNQTIRIYSMQVWTKSDCTAPTSKTLSGTTSICSGDNTNVTLASSQSGVTYQLYAGETASGDLVEGDGNDIVWSVSPAATTTYTVKSTTAGGYCEAAMDGSAVITVKSAPAITGSSLSDATYGQNYGSASALSVTATGDGLSYQWYKSTDESNATSADDEAVGTNSNSFTPSTATIGTSYYYCVVSGDCSPAATSDVSGSIVITAPVPVVSLSSGSNNTSVTYNNAMVPAVYTYENVADDANVLSSWYTDDTYVTTTSAPSGLSFNKDTEAKTLTLSGTPLALGTFYYKVIANETDGNSISGTVQVNEPPAPTVSLTSGSANQALKAGNAISAIVYTLTNASGATTTGLPDGLSGNYDNGVYTISGTINALETAGTYDFTVTATALAGYGGTAVTSAGTIVVKSATAKEILYLTAASTPSPLDTKLYPALNNSPNYNVTVRQAATSVQTYDNYDLIVLNEAIDSKNGEIIAIKNVDKPILNLKSFVYHSTDSRWDWGVPDNGKANNGTVTVKQPTHPIFTGISLTGGDLELLAGAAAKGIQPADISIGGINVATAPKNASPYHQAVAIHDVPASVRGVENSKYLLVAICNDSYDKMTANALLLLENAVEYLLNGTQFVPEPIYFRSNATTGNWNNSLIWQSSADNVNWNQDVASPSSTNASSISIINPHTITVTENATAAALNINAGAKLTLSADRTFAVENLTINSDATDGTGTIVDLNATGGLTVSGTTIVNQYLAADRNWYVSSPVIGATSAVVKAKSGSKLWSYDEENSGTVIWNEITTTDVPLVGVTGYIAKLAADDVVTFTGALNTGDISSPVLTRNGTVSSGYNLVGNPYPSYLNWNDAVKTNVSTSIWYRSKNTGLYLFQTYNSEGAVGTNGGTALIPPLQSFWVRVSSGTGSVAFANSMRSHQDQSQGSIRLKAPAQDLQQLVRLQVSNALNSDEAIVYFNDNAQDGFDTFDSPKMSNGNAAIPEIYTLAGTDHLAINGQKSLVAGKVIPLGFSTGQQNEFTIKATEVKNIDTDTKLILIDNLLDAEMDITDGADYNFSSDAVNTDSRFSIQFRSPSVTTAIENNANDNWTMNVYKNANNQIVVTSNLHHNGLITITNAAGQKLISTSLTGTTTIVDKSFGAGVYFVTVTVTVAGNKATSKIIIQQ
jgi:hypothetical protein